MNIITSITTRVEEARTTNKNPCKSYATMENAEKAISEVAMKCAEYFHSGQGPCESAQYFIVFIPSWGRWVGAINLSEVMRRPTSRGGYLGICGDHFTY